MAKVVCECGCVLTDNTDYLSYKARYIADQDFFDFMDEVEKEALSKQLHHSWRYLGYFFQCPECNNLIVFDPANRRRCDFMPLKKSDSKEITFSYFGENWKGHLFGHYYGSDHPLEYKRCKGELHWNTNKECGYKRDLTLEELRDSYYSKFRELSSQGIIRSCFLQVDGVEEHCWDCNNIPSE